MREHRVIERIIALLKGELGKIAGNGEMDHYLLDAAIDFLETYSDRCHHGKEEDILFRELKKKDLSADHSAIIDELIEEHGIARNTVARLKTAKERHAAGEAALHEVSECIKTLIGLYPKHIEKEDRHFFFPSLQYLSRQEQDSMLVEFSEFDGKLIHEIYEEKIKEIEARKDRHS